MLNSCDSLAFQIARAGYDVWLGNNRGSIYSKEHTSLDYDKDAKFFDYSFYELGKYDLPAQINYVLQSTQYEKLTYIGHSQGTTQMYSNLAEANNQMSEKINLFINLAPITKIGDGQENKILKKGLPYITKAYQRMGCFNLGTDMDKIKQRLSYVISEEKINSVHFQEVQFSDQINEYRAKIANMREQNTVSSKILTHFLQLKATGELRKFDYGHAENTERYGQQEAPIIDLKTTLQDSGNCPPIALFVGDHDPYSTKYVAEWIKSQVGDENVVHFEQLEN